MAIAENSTGKGSSAPLLTAILMAVLQSARIAWLVSLPDGLLVQHIPDDAFYYLVLAKNYVKLGRWTFDGVSSSTGFHLLWGYILAAIYKLFPSITFKEIFVAGSLLAALSISIAAGLCISAVGRIYNSRAGWAAAVVLFSAASMLQGTWMLESPFVILMASVLLFQLSVERKFIRPAQYGTAVLFGFLGSMARSDFGLLPFWLFVTSAVLAKTEKRWLPQAKIAAGQFVGACAGVLAVLLHVYSVSGHMTQASAQTKLWWSSVVGRGWGGLRVGENTLSPFYNSVAYFQHNFWSDHLAAFIAHRSRTLLLALVLIGVIAFFVKNRWNRPAAFTACAILVTASYCFFYRFDGAVQDWYVANYEIPFILLAAAAWCMIPSRWLVAGRAVVLALIVSGFIFSLRAHAPWQEAMYRSGLLIRQHPEWKPVGAWNSGIMSYFAGGGVVNLDGLVNDDIVPSIRNGTLANYVAQRGISHIIESPGIFTAIYAKRSGIADGRLYSCVRDKRELFPHDPFDIYEYTHITLFYVDDTCLKQHPSAPNETGRLPAMSGKHNS